MKKALLLTGALLALTSSFAFAAGDINIAWGDCPPGWGGPGTIDKVFACNTTSGADTLFASFSPPDTMQKFNGHAGVVDVQTSSATLSRWWHLEPGGCRDGQLTASFDFTGGPYNCLDVWAGAALGGVSVNVTGANRFRVRTVCAIASPTQVDPGGEYYVFKLMLRHLKTVGTACPGCLDAACFVFNQIQLTQPAQYGSRTVTTGPQQYATWRGGMVGIGPYGGVGCPAATPTRRTTWGSVKALYR